MTCLNLDEIECDTGASIIHAMKKTKFKLIYGPANKQGGENGEWYTIPYIILYSRLLS